MVNVLRYEVGQISELGPTPQGLNGIQFGSVGRQPLDVQPVGTALAQPADCGTVSIQSIHHHDQRAAMLTMQFAQVAHYMRRADFLFLYVEEDARPSSPWPP